MTDTTGELLPDGSLPPEAFEEGEVIEVTGTRATIQTFIEEKRASDTIVDALTAEDIGDIPALSIGEALETLPAAASHREQGGATEISIRGMGPYLGSTVINGREASNGSGDRSVNFSQFPSELFNKLKIYKTQEASLIEGGVSGQIYLETIKPLEYGKRRLQIDLKGSYNPDEANIESDMSARSIGNRLTLSYVDQFKLDRLGELGVSVGYQRNVATNPEQEYRSGSEWRACRNDPSVEGGVYSPTAADCSAGSGALDLEVDPATGEVADADAPFILVPSARSYRQNLTDDRRESAFGAVQWKPIDKVDINFDVQLSDRTFTENRNDLVFSEQRRVVPGVTAPTLDSSDSGKVSLFETVGLVETNSSYQERIEDYRGGGLNVSVAPTDRLRFSLDGSYSGTKRRENIFETRLQSAERIFTSMAVPDTGVNVPLATVRNFNVNDPSLFTSNARTRVDLNQLRESNISALRGDVEFRANHRFVSTVQAGVRYSQLDFKSSPRAREETTGFAANTVLAANEACRNQVFPESNFLSNVNGGNPLITNVDGSGNVISSGSSYASFNAQCLAESLLGYSPDYPEATPSVSDVDVEERTAAAYVQANYGLRVFDRYVRGNAGLRLVNTNVDSVGLRTTFTTMTNPDGTLSVEEDADSFKSVVGGNDYTELLPSFNLVVDLNDTLVLRGAIFRGLSRPDPDALGYGRILAIDDSAAPTTREELVGNAVASGDPNLQPLTSWNFDAAVEMYPNPDTILAVGGYYKRFRGGFESVQRAEIFELDGEPFEVDVVTSQTDENASNLLGVEVSAAHAFTYLPGLLRGFGAKLNLNLAYSDFELEDENLGDAVVYDEDGTIERVGIVPPANLFGFSKTVLSMQLYYQIGDFDAQVLFKHRGAYFQQFVDTPGIIRYIGSNSVLEARLTYKITKDFSAQLEAINLLDEPRTQYIPTPDNVAEINTYGPRLFFGVRAKL